MGGVRQTPRDVGHFEIDLGKFGLSIFATVLVAEALCDLEIFVNCTGANEELFRLLWGLWERVKKGGVISGTLGSSARDEELSSAFGRRF